MDMATNHHIEELYYDVMAERARVALCLLKFFVAMGMIDSAIDILAEGVIRDDSGVPVYLI